MAKARISIGTWAYIFNQEQPTNDFHVILHKLQDLGYDGVELGSFGPHPSPASHPTKASRQKLRKEIADHGLALSGIAVDLWAFKTPGTSILDEIPAAYLTAFLGGAVAAHVRIGSPLFTHVLFGVYVAVLMWAGLVLRRPALLGVLLGRR